LSIKSTTCIREPAVFYCALSANMAPTGNADFALDYYELFSIPANATEAEIRRAYRKTSLLYHPDKVKPTPETSAKFQLLQVALNTLSDPAEKEKYDQKREAKQKRKAENDALEGRRRKMKEDLEKRETGSSASVSGTKRTWSERELEVKRIAEENQRRREAMMQAKVQRAQAEIPVEKTTTTIERSVKVRWLKEGDGLNIDKASLKATFESYGEVEDVLLLKEKRRRIDGREKKVVLGTAVVVFATTSPAENAVMNGVRDGIESIAWAAEKEPG
jgi:DnaJ family protein C protein 17